MSELVRTPISILRLMPHCERLRQARDEAIRNHAELVALRLLQPPPRRQRTDRAASGVFVGRLGKIL